MNNRKGFTLIEIILVIFLMTLIVGMSAAVFTRSIPSQQAFSTAREIMATFRQARSEAISRGSWQSVVIDMENRNFGIEGKTAKRKIPDSVSVKIADSVNGTLIGGAYRFVFSPSGVAEGGKILITAGRQKIVLDIDPVVGMVFVEWN